MAIIEILVVDDDLKSAESFAELIESKTQLKSFPTDDPATALEKVRTEAIKVVVLDQRMPVKSGIALYEDIKHIDSRVKAIMFSGEATGDEVGKGFEKGFVRYLHKNEVEKLPELVRKQYIKYLIDLDKTSRFTPPISLFSKNKGFLFLGHTINYYLYQLDILEEEYWYSNRWETIKQINAGQTLTEEDTIELETNFVHEESEEVSLAPQLSGSLSALREFTSKLDIAISKTFKDTTSISHKRTVKVTRTYGLPQEPSDPAQLHIKSRHYQRTPVYRRLRCLVVQRCNCCGIQQPLNFIVSQPTSKIATKQTDYLSDKSLQETFTGIENL